MKTKVYVSALAESRKRCLTHRAYKSPNVVLNSDEDQLLSVLYAPNRSGFPDVTLRDVLSTGVRPELQPYVEKLMYKGDSTGSPDSDAALSTIIPRQVQYGAELSPYVDKMLDYVVNVKNSRNSQKDEK